MISESKNGFSLKRKTKMSKPLKTLYFVVAHKFSDYLVPLRLWKLIKRIYEGVPAWTRMFLRDTAKAGAKINYSDVASSVNLPENGYTRRVSAVHAWRILKQEEERRELKGDRTKGARLLFCRFFNHSFRLAAYSRYVYLPAHHGIPIKDGFHSPTRAMTNLSLGSWQAVNVHGSLLTLASRRRREEHLIILDAKRQAEI